MKRSLLPVLFFTFWITGTGLHSMAQVNIQAGSLTLQNFNSMGTAAAATLPPFWKMSATGAGSAAGFATVTNITATTQAASTGTPATGGAYNWATTAGTDRAIGFMTSAVYTSTNAILAWYRNTTGVSVNTVTIAFNLERYIVNTATVTVAFYSSADGIVWTAQPSADISSSDFATAANAGTFGSPKTISKTITINTTIPNNGDIYFRWVFTNTGNVNAQGLGLDDVVVFAGAATPDLTAQLEDILQVDNGTIGVFNEGDVIRYRTVVKNNGSGSAGNVQLNFPTPPPNTTLIGGSVKTSAVAVDDNYNASFNTILNGTTVLANDFGVPLPTVVQTFGPSANPSATTAGNSGISDIGAILLVNTNGTFTYTPPTGFSGTDHFKYVTGNGNLPNNDALVTVIVGTDISFSTNNIDPLCNGGSTGSITFTATGGNGTLLYSITGAAGTYQASNIFTGLASGTYNLAVKDAGGYIKTGTATLNNPALLVVSGTIGTIIYTTAMTTATFTKTGGTGTITWSATGLPPGVSINNSTGAVTGTPTQTGTFNIVVTATDVNGCTGTRNVSFNVVPKLTDDPFNIVGNTQFVSDAHSAPPTPFTASATNILANDLSDAAITITAVTNAATTGGGTITINAAGKFTYTPPNGSTTADSYTYTATSNGVSATATINLTIANMIWYINNTYAGANGTANGSSHRPYTDAAAATTAASVNQYIYVHAGTGNTTGNAVLKSGQTLRGAGTALSVGALSIAAATNPTLSGTVTLANSVTVDGFHMSTGTTTALSASAATTVAVSVGNITTSGAVNAVTLTNTTGTVTIAGGSQTNSTASTFNISGGTLSLTYSGTITQGANAAMVTVSGGHATGTITFQTGALSATNGTGLQFDNADGIYNFNGAVTLNGGDAGIDIINGSSGNFSFLNAPITNPSGTAFNVSGGNGSIGHAGTISKNNAGRIVDIQSRTGGSVSLSGNLSSTSTATGINVSSCSGGTITFSGTTKTISTGTNPAVTLATNTGATINFTGGGLAVITTSGAGFNATGGGTISVQGTVNTIISTTGTALNVSNTTISAGGLTFRSISCNGSVSGIILNTTGALGGLTVTGLGNATQGGDNSGGTIQSTTGDGISLTSTSNVSLTNLQILNIGGAGAQGIDASNLGGSNYFIAGRMNNVGSAASGNGNGITLVNTTTNLTLFSVQNSIFQNSASGTSHVLNNPNGAITTRLDVINSLFEGLDALAVQSNSAANAIVTTNITGNIFRNANANGQGGIAVTTAAGSLGSNTFLVSNNTYFGLNNGVASGANAGTLTFQTTGGLLSGTVSNNTIGTAADDNGDRRGIEVVSEPDVSVNGNTGRIDVIIEGNIINRYTDREAIFVDLREDTQNSELIIRNNNIGNLSGFVGQVGGIREAVDVQVRGEVSYSLNLLVTGNNVTANSSAFTVNLEVNADAGSPGAQSMNATVTGNTFNNLNASGIANLVARTRTSDPLASICLNMSGNTLGGSLTTISVEENSGTVNVQQTSSANLGAANGGAPVSIVGTPSFSIGCSGPPAGRTPLRPER